MSYIQGKDPNKVTTSSGAFTLSQNNIIIDETVLPSSKEPSRELSGTNKNGLDVLKKVHLIDDEKNIALSQNLSEKYRLIVLDEK